MNITIELSILITIVVLFVGVIRWLFKLESRIDKSENDLKVMEKIHVGQSQILFDKIDKLSEKVESISEKLSWLDGFMKGEEAKGKGKKYGK